MTEADGQKYTVYVDDNFHYMDEEERYTAGYYDTCEAATEKCKSIVDEFLLDQYKEGTLAPQLLEAYTAFGEDPWISGPEPDCKFSAWTYAERRCQEICFGHKES
jgi:hypothetical protein